jgi:hypothetical protein
MQSPLRTSEVWPSASQFCTAPPTLMVSPSPKFPQTQSVWTSTAILLMFKLSNCAKIHATAVSKKWLVLPVPSNWRALAFDSRGFLCRYVYFLGFFGFFLLASPQVSLCMSFSKASGPAGYSHKYFCVPWICLRLLVQSQDVDGIKTILLPVLTFLAVLWGVRWENWCFTGCTCEEE